MERTYMNGGTPLAGWFTMKTIKIRMIWGCPHVRKPQNTYTSYTQINHVHILLQNCIEFRIIYCS